MSLSLKMATVNALKFLMLFFRHKCQNQRGDPDQTASEEAV